MGFHGSTAPNTYYTHLHATFRVFNVGIDLGFHVCTAPSKARSRPRLGFYILGIGLGFLRQLPSLFRSRGKRRSLAVQLHTSFLCQVCALRTQRLPFQLLVLVWNLREVTGLNHLQDGPKAKETFHFSFAGIFLSGGPKPRAAWVSPHAIVISRQVHATVVASLLRLKFWKTAFYLDFLEDDEDYEEE